jgi:hypothetical protein
MKKVLFTALLMLSISANAQVYQKGSKFINAGLGLSPGIGLNVSADLGIHEAISAGAFVMYQKWGGAIGYGRLGVGVKADYHLAEILKKANISIDTEKMDPYAGISFGVAKYNGTYTGIGTTHLIGGGHLGLRYMLKPALGFFGEIGYDVTYLKAGVSLKLGK